MNSRTNVGYYSVAERPQQVAMGFSPWGPDIRTTVASRSDATLDSSTLVPRCDATQCPPPPPAAPWAEAHRYHPTIATRWTPSGFLTPLAFAACLCATLAFAQAGVPLPDHLVYGTISLSGRAVTSADTNIVVEARRPLDGHLLASYRMGSAARLGNFLYELRIKVEQAPASSADIAQLGETLTVSVNDSTGVLDQAVHQLNDAGVALRLDFGASVDANQNGIPDAWELAHFGSTSTLSTSDRDGDGTSDLYEYIAGTDPMDPTDAFRLVVETAANQLKISFLARSAAGAGYEGRKRFYALETSADLATTNWQEVDSYSRIPGTNQLVIYQTPRNPSGPILFRARVWLEGP